MASPVARADSRARRVRRRSAEDMCENVGVGSPNCLPRYAASTRQRGRSLRAQAFLCWPAPAPKPTRRPAAGQRRDRPLERPPSRPPDPDTRGTPGRMCRWPGLFNQEETSALHLAEPAFKESLGVGQMRQQKPAVDQVCRDGQRQPHDVVLEEAAVRMPLPRRLQKRRRVIQADRPAGACGSVQHGGAEPGPHPKSSATPGREAIRLRTHCSLSGFQKDARSSSRFSAVSDDPKV